MTNLLGGRGADLALIDVRGAQVTYGELRSDGEVLRARGHRLAFLRAENTVACVRAYVACLEAGVPVLLLDRDIHDETLAALLGRYRPDLLFNLHVPDGYREWQDNPFGIVTASTESRVYPHPELALLLSTSGSTGTPKLVRLSSSSVVSNAASIASGLEIESSHRAISSLPYSYTYGLSVINSHLLRGAVVVLTDAAVVAREFWNAVEEHQVTSIAGVPSSYKMLRQMRWDPHRYSSLLHATQAGGRLSDEDRKHFLGLFDAIGAKFWVMYGQTEATARMTIARPEDLRAEISTAGRVIEGGRIEVVSPDETGSGEIVYHGPNVMWGYAEDASDLTLGDELGGVLHTGDLGYVQDGLLFLTGRSKRIVKVFGKRVSLDDVERWLARRLEAVAVQGDDVVVVVAVGPADADPQVRLDLAEYLGVHPSGVRLARVDKLPLMSNGKVDLQGLRKVVG